MTITARQLLDGDGNYDLAADPADLRQVNMLANIVDKTTRARLRGMEADVRLGNTVTRAEFDAALTSVYALVESECGPRMWQMLTEAGADFASAKELMLTAQERIYQKVASYGLADTTAE